MSVDLIAAAEMPSNIALIKYMGKVSGGDKNKPTNSSLSLTLGRLKSKVEIHRLRENYDSWATLDGVDWMPTQLSDRGRKRFLAHFGFLKQKLGMQGTFLVKSANNFPSDCGIASSASSFAALTQSTYLAAKILNPQLDFNLSRLAELSRVGSGSSIRSFLGPLVLWNNEGISEIEIPYKNLRNRVVIVEQSKKEIGSSDAHERVPSSLLFRDRPERAEERLNQLKLAFQNLEWRRAFEIVWAEFWDMHALFETSAPPFGYLNSESLMVLKLVADFWNNQKDGPLVTMDAGPNVHLIYREDQLALSENLEHRILSLFNEDGKQVKII